MLKELLGILEGGRTWSVSELARRLGEEEEMVRAQLEYLEKMGKLKKVVHAGCGGSCGGACSCAGGGGHGPVMWEKGPA